MLQLSVPKAHSAERAEFLLQRVSDLKGGDVAMYEVSTRNAFLAGRIATDSDLAIDLSPLRSLVAAERERAAERRAAELRMLEQKAVMIALRRRAPDPAAALAG